jgi:hypothetical protein
VHHEGREYREQIVATPHPKFINWINCFRPRGNHMKIRTGVIGVAASLVLAGSVAGTAHASVSTVPFITGVSLKMVEPGTLTKSGSLAGSFDVDIIEDGASSTANYYNLYRITAEYGDQEIETEQYGQSATDLVLDSFGTTTYEVQACEYDYGTCQVDGGGPHGGVESVTFTPKTLDNPFAVASGTGSVASSSKYYGGSALQTTTSGASVTWTTDDVYNLGVVIDTGPKGGIGTVYVDGKKVKGAAGQINFYSAKVTGCIVDFKFGTSSAEVHTITIVETEAGAKGGVNMTLDAGVEFAS